MKKVKKVIIAISVDESEVLTFHQKTKKHLKKLGHKGSLSEELNEQLKNINESFKKKTNKGRN